MCGHAGYLRLHDNNHHAELVRRVYTNLFVTSQLRGFDSSGMAALWTQEPKTQWNQKKKKKRKPRKGHLYYKDIESPSMILENIKVFADLKSEQTKSSHDPLYYNAVIGHSRAATLGSVVRSNSHPFVFFNGRFIGAHNGTIRNAKYVINRLRDKEEPREGTLETDEPYHDYQDHSFTDSEIILYCIYRWGIEKVYPLIQGAWSFVYYDQITNKMYIIRNDERSLWVYMPPGLGVIFWSSEKEMLEFALLRESARMKRVDRPDEKDFKYFKEHHLYVIDMDRTKGSTTIFDDVKDLSDLLKKLSYSGGYSGWYGNHYKGSKPRHSVPAISQTPDAKSLHVKHVNAVFCDLSSKDKEEDNGDCDKECCWCGADIMDSGNLDMVFRGNVGETKYLCFECNSDWYIVNTIIEDYPHLGDDNKMKNVFLLAIIPIHVAPSR